MLWNGENLDFKRFLGKEKVHRNSIKITVDLWRSERDCLWNYIKLFLRINNHFCAFSFVFMNYKIFCSHCFPAFLILFREASGEVRYHERLYENTRTLESIRAFVA